MSHRSEHVPDPVSDANGDRSRMTATRGTGSRSIPVVIVGRRDIHNLGLRQLLIQNFFRNVFEAPTLKEVKLAPPGKPQLILITEPAHEMGLLETIAAVRTSNEEARIVVLVDTGNDAAIEAALKLSAHAFLRHQIIAQALANALDVVLDSSGVLSFDFVPQIVARSTNPSMKPEHDSKLAPIAPPLWTLSTREEDILKCLADGVSNKIIARKFDIAESTVKIHVKSILRKINVCNRTQAAIWALARAPWQAASVSVQEIRV